MEPPEPAGVQVNGPVVRKLRKLAGENLTDLARKAGITFQYLSQIERGDRNSISPPVFVRLCDGLGVAAENRHELIRNDAPSSAGTSA